MSGTETSGAQMSWSQWSETAFGTPYEVWHDGLNIYQAVTTFAGSPELASAMLLEGIGEHDALAAKVVDALVASGHPVPSLVAALRAVHDKGGWDFAIASASALYRETREDTWDGWLLRALSEGPSWSFRIDAAIALRGFAASPTRIEALAAGIGDAEYLVRYHCATTLLRYAGDQTELSELPVFKDILDEPAADAVARHARAASELKARAAA